MKIALGTVQFGLEYGVANQLGMVQFDDVKLILQEATAHGVETLDTAIVYGNSERVLGQAGVNEWKIVTKLPALPEVCTDVAGWVEAQLEGSIKRLGVSQLHGVLLHRPGQLLNKNGESLYQALQLLKSAGLTKKIGISVYGPDELDMIMAKMAFDLVQAPLNILDRRLIESGWDMRLKNQGTELHVRSAFLQGLLLMEPDQRPQKFARWEYVWHEWARWLDETGLTPLQACLGYVLGIELVDKVVVGVDSVKHLQEIIAASGSSLPSLPNWSKPTDIGLIDPTLWNQL
jgi:aryl-alcohol dehydrogenase-like predicted oxidoreductase